MAVRHSSGGTVITLPRLGAGGKPMRLAAEEIAQAAREISGRWSSRIPGSITVSVNSDGKSATITAGGDEAPAAYTMEGRNSGKPIAHPVYGHGERIRGPMVGRDRKTGKARYKPPGWTWEKQEPRPFMKEAADAASDKAADKWGTALIDAWTRSAGFK